MDAELKAKWVAALRSGQYRQTTGKLRDSHGHCCLGVLCDISDKSGWIEVTDEDEDEAELSVVAFLYREDNEDEFAPEMLLSRDVQKPLSEMNDNGKTFAEIADHIEKNL